MNTQENGREANNAEKQERTRQGRFYSPNVDILEKKEELVLYVDIPGSSPEDIDVQFENGTLTINGKVRARQPSGVVYLTKEYDVADFQRSFKVQEQIDGSKIAASYTNGVLTLHLPKYQAAQAKKVTVTAG